MNNNQRIENQQSIAILGCGISGLSMAQILSQKRDIAITLFDSYGRLGGNHLSFNKEGFTFDIGTFIFSDDGDFFNLFKSIESHYIEAKPNFGRINPKANFDVYPFSLSNYYRESSLLSFAIDVVDLFVSKLVYIKKQDVPAYAKYYLGTRIYHKSGLKNYIERFYGIPDSEIALPFALKRMAMIGESASIRNNIFKIFRKPQAKSERIFIRPRSGFDVIYNTLQTQMESAGIQFRLSTPIEKITKKDGLYTIHYQNRTESFDRIITTIPVNETLRLIQAKHFFKLPAHNLLSLFIKLDGKFNFEGDVLYNFMDTGTWKRLTIYSRLYGKFENQDYFTVEVPFDSNENINVRTAYDEVIIHLKHRFLEGIPTLVGSNILENAYPVYTKSHGANIIASKKKVSDFGIEMAGRQGNFDYIPSSNLVIEKTVEFVETTAQSIKRFSLFL